MGTAVVGNAEGLPGVTVGLPVVGAPVVGAEVLGLELGEPGVTVGTPVEGTAAGLTVAQS